MIKRSQPQQKPGQINQANINFDSNSGTAKQTLKNSIEVGSVDPQPLSVNALKARDKDEYARSQKNRHKSDAQTQIGPVMSQSRTAINSKLAENEQDSKLGNLLSKPSTFGNNTILGVSNSKSNYARKSKNPKA